MAQNAPPVEGLGDAVKRFPTTLFAALLLFGIGSTMARADTVWTALNAQFGFWADANGVAYGTQNHGPDYGLLSGSFTIDNAGNVTSFDLTTTASAYPDNPYFSGWTYDNASASVTDISQPGSPLTLLQFTTNAPSIGGPQETLSLVFVNNLLSGQTIGTGYSLLCTTDNAIMQGACSNTPSTEFNPNTGNQDPNNLAVNDPYRALGTPIVDPPGCGRAACFTASPLLVPVPEPGSMPLLLTALAGLGWVVWRRRERAL